jgi:methylmalonyl-CoA/ethylmalonyl-CoA epimerase
MPVMKKIEHIGIAVKNFEVSVPLYEKMLNTTCYKQELVASEKVNTAFFKVGESKIELVCSTDPEGVIARYIDKKGEGIHHIAYEVEDIYTEMARMQAEGFTLLQETPKRGADNKWVCFLHPKDTGGVLVELCQEIIEAK